MKRRQVVAAPIGRVFKLIDDPQQMRRWMQGLEETTVISRPEGGGRVGTRFRQRLVEGGRIAEYDGEITAYEKPHHFAARIGNAAFSMDVDYRLSEAEKGTRIDYTVTLAHGTFASRLTDVLARPLTRRLVRRQLKRLKEAAESRR